MLVGADHEERTGTPAAVVVELPPSLDPLHRCAAFVAGRRGKGDQLRSVHGVSASTRSSGRSTRSSSAPQPGTLRRALSRLRAGEKESLAGLARSTASASSQSCVSEVHSHCPRSNPPELLGVSGRCTVCAIDRLPIATGPPVYAGEADGLWIKSSGPWRSGPPRETWPAGVHREP
jgi:hypothetical protein